MFDNAVFPEVIDADHRERRRRVTCGRPRSRRCSPNSNMATRSSRRRVIAISSPQRPGANRSSPKATRSRSWRRSKEAECREAREDGWQFYGVELSLAAAARHGAISLARNSGRCDQGLGCRDRDRLAAARIRAAARRAELLVAHPRRSACACCPTPPAATREGSGDDRRTWRARCSTRRGSSSK